MNEPAASGRDEGDRRVSRGDERQAGGTSGAFWGTSSILRTYVCIVGITAAVITVNVFSWLHDHPRDPLVYPAVYEGSSGVAIIALAGIVLFAARIAPPEPRRWPRFALVHAVGSLAFSAGHIVVMAAVRFAVFAALRVGYRMPWSDLIYEYRKDVLTYAAIAVVFWLVEGFWRKPAEVTLTAEAPATFDILDGGRTLRTPVAEIVAVEAAGNYVEFRLADGSARMMRATLAQIERALGAHGFVRIHRSWLANAHRLRLLEPAGSGDYRLVLDGGVEAPVSRRYPAALERLRTKT